MRSIRKIIVFTLVAGTFFNLAGCGGGGESDSNQVQQSQFGEMPDGRQVDIYTLTNTNGMTIKLISLGAAITSIQVPDQNGEMGDVALGFDEVEPYYNSNFGSIIGRFANRIRDAQFTLDGETYELPANNGENTIHGGPTGFDDVLWESEILTGRENPTVEFRYVSEDGEMGFPGTLTTVVEYSLTDENEIVVDYTANTDEKTVVNMTNHSYFNLSGEGNGTILNQRVMLNASQFLPADDEVIPTGEISSVEGTPMDFTQPTAIGTRIDNDFPTLNNAGGYDHTWVLDKDPGEFGLAARVTDPESGRIMEVYTTEPGVQFYTGNNLDGSLVGKSGEAYTKRSGFCLEVQHFPDSPHHPNFPSTVLEPNETYTQRTVYKFSTQ